MAQYIDKAALVAEIERRKEYYENIQMIKPVYESNIEDFKELLYFIDTFEVKEEQEEPVRGDFEMALAEMIDKAQKCVVEPWVVAAQWKDELVKLAKECKTMQEHPKDCMYSKDNYTDEDRKILCEGCEEECIEKMNEERKRDLSLWSLGDFENKFFEITEPYKDSRNYKNLCIRLVMWQSELWRWIHWKKRKEEPVSEDLGEYINELSKQFPEVSFAKLSRIAVRVAKWQKEQLMANTADAMIGLPYENKDGGYTHLIDVSRPLPVGNNKIAIIFKED